MAILLQNRTISMILTVPDVEPSTSSSSIIEKLDRSDNDQSCSILTHEQESNIDKTSSMPVYHGSILRIEQHTDDQNSSDLIIRVPNFQRLKLSSNDNNNNNTKQQTRIKRRAPICPILNQTNLQNNSNLNLKQSRPINKNRLTTGLRSLSRAFTYGCRSKRSSSINDITLPSSLPDVEVMTEKLQISKSSTKNTKQVDTKSTIPKLTTPKILFIKRNHSKIRNRQSSQTSTHDQMNTSRKSTILTTEYSDINRTNSPILIPRFIEEKDFNQQTQIPEDDDDDDDEREQQNDSMRLTYEVEQHLATISQLISDLPVSSVDAYSLSTHRYSTISAIIPDIQISTTDNHIDDHSFTEIPSKISIKNNRPFRVQTSLLQPDISVIRMGTNDLTTSNDRLLPGETSSFKEQISKDDHDIEQGWYGVIRSDDETFAETYEVTYQIDPTYQNENKQIINQSCKIDLDPYEYKTLLSKSFSNKTQNIYEQIQPKTISNELRIKSHSVDDLSQISSDHQSDVKSRSSSSETSSRHCILHRSNSSNDFGISISTDVKTHHEHLIHQVEQLSPGDQAGLKENDRILCINGTPVIEEDYTVVLQLIKHGLQTDTLDFHVITNDEYEQFKSEIDQLYQ